MDLQAERQRIWQAGGGLQHDLNILPTSGTGYFAFIRTFKTRVTINHVYVLTAATAGSGGQTAEIGLFTTPSPPNKSNQSLSVLTATGSLGNLTTASSYIGNTVAFNQSVEPGTNLWAGFRPAMATTQPRLADLHGDRGLGYVQVAAASGVLTGAGPFAGVVPALASIWVGVAGPSPAFWVTAD
jgi:hypothetical protein